MKQGSASRTAEMAAVARAIHRLHHAPVIFDDDYALQLLSPSWQRLARSKVLQTLLGATLFRSQRPIAAQVIARSRFAEDQLQMAVDNGVQQYVILGAGFDTYALRRSARQQGVRIFELDYPGTQQLKIQRVREVGIEMPGNLEFVAIDFERQSAPEALKDSGYRADLPAFYSWLGTTPYLSNAATLDVLQSIAGYAASGSAVVFDYLVADQLLAPLERRKLQRLRRFTARRGEPIVGSFDPVELEARLRALGLALLDDLDYEAQVERYFATRSDDLRPMSASRFAHVKVV